MDKPDQGARIEVKAGLCATCQFRQWVHNDRGGVFLLCLAHKTHPGMPKYPPLPVLNCPVYFERTQP